MYSYSIQFVWVLGAWGTAAFFVHRMLHPGLTGINGECRADSVCPHGFYFVLVFLVYTGDLCLSARVLLLVGFFLCTGARLFVCAGSTPCGVRKSYLSVRFLPYVGFLCYTRASLVCPHVFYPMLDFDCRMRIL